MSRRTVEREFLLILIISGVYQLGRNIVDPLHTLFFVEVGASRVELGFIMAILPFVAMSSRIPLSTLMDRFGKTTVVFLSNVIVVVASVAYAFTYEVAWLYPVTAMNALSWTLFLPAAHSLALDLSPEDRRAEYMGKYFTGNGIMMLIGPLLTSFLVLYLDYRSVFLISAIPSFLGMLLMIRLGQVRRVKTEEGTRRLWTSFRGIKEILRIREFWVVSAARTTFWVATSAFATLFAIYCKETLLLTTSMISLLFAGRGLSNSLTRIPAGALSDRIGRKKPILLAYIVVAVTFFALSEFSAPSLLMLAMLAYGLSWGTKVVSETTLLGDVVPPERTGVAMAIWQTVDDAARVVGSTVAGASTLLMDVPALFRFMSMLLTFGVCIVLFLVPEATKK